MSAPMAAASANASESFVGTTVGRSSATPTRRYTLLRRLAIGGMGELLLARASGAGGVQKLVAIKRIRSEYASDPAFVSMFLNEARLAATLDHPNVVRTYDLVDDDGSFFMVMEYLHGESLGRLLNHVVAMRERVPLVHVITIALGIAAGLHCAHERRGVDGRPLDIVHRDLSPGNVFLTYEGGVKLLDFGIAKATSRTSITLGPTRKGKVSYMSPEQCVGAEVDRRSDIFALGVVLWELCTGRRLFRGDNEFAIMNQITTVDAPAANAVVPELPRELSDILARALQREPAARYQSAMELHDAVESFAAAMRLLPSAAALGRYLAEVCGEREYPSVEPAPEFADRMAATLVVAGAAPRRGGRRSLGLVAALVGGVVVGGAAVAIVGGGATPREVAASPSEPAAASTAAAPAAAAPIPVAVPIAAPAASPASPPSPTVAATTGAGEAEPASEASTSPPPVGELAGRRRNARAKRSASTPEPAPRKSDKSVRGVDGLLPGG
ncbi:MAG: serine/threonine protein kinase [Nannocystaceae bacterium]|nr:serine/threonine protein kinase [Nannocystaceae bacterium]